eukprot:Colp12_sorted_trinity150504_noHs@25940
MTVQQYKQRLKKQKIKRPLNPFFLWAVEQRNMLKEAKLNGGEKVHSSDLSRLLGEQWKALSKEEKEIWYEKAGQVKKEHSARYPGYKFCPEKRQRSSEEDSPSDEQNTAADSPTATVSQKTPTAQSSAKKDATQPLTDPIILQRIRDRLNRTRARSTSTSYSEDSDGESFVTLADFDFMDEDIPTEMIEAIIRGEEDLAHLEM